MGFRVIKTGTRQACCHLNYRCLEHTGATSAGLLTILGVDVTRKQVCAPYRQIVRFIAGSGAGVYSILFSRISLLGIGSIHIACLSAISKANFKKAS